MEWSPPSANGTFPASRVLITNSACLVQVAVISFKYLAWVSPSFFCSGMATGTLPPSSTSCPNASRRASNPATLTAEGPISTPRRDWPRSSGTPITRIFLGAMLVVLMLVIIELVEYVTDTIGAASAGTELFLAHGRGRRSRSEEHTSELQ